MDRNQFAAALAHPFTLLVAGALLSSYLLPFVTRRWQNQQHEHALKVGLVSEISQSTTMFVMSIQFAEVGAGSQSQTAYDTAYMDWQTRSAVLRAKLEAYFPDTALARDWARMSEALELLYAASGTRDDPDARTRILREVETRLRAPYAPGGRTAPTVGQSGVTSAGDWQIVRDHLLSGVAELNRSVLRSPSAPFSRRF